jgi:hypothetical protein
MKINIFDIIIDKMIITRDRLQKKQKFPDRRSLYKIFQKRKSDIYYSIFILISEAFVSWILHEPALTWLHIPQLC